MNGSAGCSGQRKQKRGASTSSDCNPSCWREAEALLLAWLHPPQGQGTEPFGPLGAEHPQQSVEMSDASASQQIDDIVRRTAGWRGERLSQLRALIRGADPGVIEEVKWKKASRPE